MGGPGLTVWAGLLQAEADRSGKGSGGLNGGFRRRGEGLGSGREPGARSLRSCGDIQSPPVIEGAQEALPREPTVLEGSLGKGRMVRAASPEVGGLSSRKAGSHGPPPAGSTFTPVPQHDEDAEAMSLMPCSSLHDRKPLEHGH